MAGPLSSPKCCPISGAGTSAHTCHQPEHTFVLNCSVQNILTWSLGFFKLSFPLSCYTGKAGDFVFSLQYFYQYQYSEFDRLLTLGEPAWSPTSVLPPVLFDCSYSEIAHLCVCSWAMLELRGGQFWGSGSSWGMWGLKDGEHQPWSLCATVGQCRWPEVVAEVKLGGAGHSLWEHSSLG